MSQTNPPDIKKAMISSTARDLPEHRDLVKDACLRQGMFPIMMEHLPASDTGALAESLRMVDEADLYLGIYAYRYGTIPKGYDLSVTEMEYNRAGERGIPRLIFIMDKTHPIRFQDVEMGEGAAKLEAFKSRVKSGPVVNFFKSPQELQTQVIDTLSKHRRPNLTAFHYISDIPTPPEPYIAHPFTLLQTPTLIGRQGAVNLLTDWVTKPDSEIYKSRVLCIVAIGGIGKSALSWKWFRDIAPNEMQPLAGRLWWSFYESDATFENFVIRALAYVSCRAQEEIEKLTPSTRESQLLAILDREPYLFVLDGLERLLIAYALMDAPRLTDDDLDQRTANYVAGALGLAEGITHSFTSLHRLRKTADLRSGFFLRKLASVNASRILVSTRLYPADLQTDTGMERSGCHAFFLHGLSDDDALDLWRAFGISGSRESLLQLFHSFDNHPLLIQVLAGEIAHDRRAPSDFVAWRKNHPSFNPFDLPLVQVRSHVLAFALGELDEITRKVLSTIAAFRMATTYDTLAALLVGKDKHFANEDALVAALTDLEDRGLLGWDRRANRYDLHPIVRGVAWNGLNSQAKQDIYGTMYSHFSSFPITRKINKLEDLIPAVELFNALIGLEHYQDAHRVFLDRLHSPTLYGLSASRQRADWLEMLFPDGVDHPPRLRKIGDQIQVLNDLGLSYKLAGQPGRAVSLHGRAKRLCEQQTSMRWFMISLGDLASAMNLSGALHGAETSARQALLLTRREDDKWWEADSLRQLGIALGARGRVAEAESALKRASRICSLISDIQREGQTTAFLVQVLLWQGDVVIAGLLSDRAWELAHYRNHERDFIRAARLQGMVALSQKNLVRAEERLDHALTRARTVNFGEGELLALVGLAEVRRQQGDLITALELLDDVWDLAEFGPYPLIHADARNILAQIQRDTGNRSAAVEAATKAYRLAWCDGPPFAYHWGLRDAKAHLSVLGASELVLPPFDVSKYEPMPEVEIEPADEQDPL